VPDDDRRGSSPDQVGAASPAYVADTDDLLATPFQMMLLPGSVGRAHAPVREAGGSLPNMHLGFTDTLNSFKMYIGYNRHGWGLKIPASVIWPRRRVAWLSSPSGRHL
jgi:hypothetical protein